MTQEKATTRAVLSAVLAFGIYSAELCLKGRLILELGTGHARYRRLEWQLAGLAYRRQVPGCSERRRSQSALMFARYWSDAAGLSGCALIEVVVWLGGGGD